MLLETASIIQKFNFCSIELLDKASDQFEILDNIEKQLLIDGIRLERVSPDKANCIIRIFQKIEYSTKFYGVYCYTKIGSEWVSTLEGEPITLNPKKHSFKFRAEKHVTKEFFDVYIEAM